MMATTDNYALVYFIKSVLSHTRGSTQEVPIRRPSYDNMEGVDASNIF